MTMIADTGPSSPSLMEFFAGRKFEARSRVSRPFKNYQPTIMALAKNFRATSLCEIGGGRAPLLREEIVKDLNAEYTILDVSQPGLDRAPSWPNKVLGDIGAKNLDSLAPGRYDLMFSHMVMEHVRDVRQAYANISRLLREGGIVINFHPTLYAAPFVVNRLTPESLTRPLVEWLDRARGSAGRPKFPAYYSWCVSKRDAEEMIRATGFKDVLIVPFWGHAYFERIPLLRQIDRAMVAAAERWGVRSLSSYAYTVARK